MKTQIGDEVKDIFTLNELENLIDDMDESKSKYLLANIFETITKVCKENKISNQNKIIVEYKQSSNDCFLFDMFIGQELDEFTKENYFIFCNKWITGALAEFDAGVPMLLGVYKFR